MEFEPLTNWNSFLSSEFEKTYFKQLVAFVRSEYTRGICYPKSELIFQAFKACPFDKVKVVVIGQDPYHGDGQADGLCFSVPEGVKFPPSLLNIFKELQTDLEQPLPASGCLMRWANQGVLMLNTTLTVRAHVAGSHQGQGWERFTDAIIEVLSREKQGLVFLLWGSQARKKGRRIDANKHHLLACGHPSPLSANRGHWFGNRHFSKTNTLLRAMGSEEISW